MAEHDRLQKEIEELQQRWDLLSGIMSQLQKQQDLETRAEEKIRLDNAIQEKKTEREKLEVQLRELESEHKKAEKTTRISEARRLERNQAYQQAVQTWEAIQELDPEDPQAEREIQRLSEMQQKTQRPAALIKQLSSRLVEIQAIFAQVVQRLKSMQDTGVIEEPLLAAVENFLTNALSAQAFNQMWTALNADTPQLPSGPTMNFGALADRIKRGFMVLFLGSDLPLLSGIDSNDGTTLVSELARQVEYVDFDGSLSMLAEYYEMRPEYGRLSLIQRLHSLQPAPSGTIQLYQLLATVEEPLILISAAQDTLLEYAFRQAQKPYVVISSVVNPDVNYDIGRVLIEYSDQEDFTALQQEQDLSTLDPLGAQYSLIYKMRGAFGQRATQPGPLQNTLMLSEENYFTFARYRDKLIPRYVVRQFSGRGLLFLGYAPKQWEDRLLVNALLSERPHQSEAPSVVSGSRNRFEEAYWRRRRIEPYALTFETFVGQLQEHF